MPRKARFANCGVIVTVHGGKAQLFCGAAKFTGQRLSAMRVEEGVVFLNGKVESDELKKWAGDLAHNTQDVVAVANRLHVTQHSVWDFRQAWMRDYSRSERQI